MGHSDETWNDVGEQFRKLGTILKHHYQTQEPPDVVGAASDDEVKEAVRVLGETVKAVIATVGDAVADPGVRDEARETAAVFFGALGATFADLADDISTRNEGKSPGDVPPPDDDVVADGSPEGD